MAEPFSFKKRQESLQRFGNETFDILVVGGGITGAATANDAASRGLKVALVEKNDFASGTSSKSSKLIHGGLRYLENLEFKLVFESLSERHFLLKTVPHMVRPLPFYMPLYQGDPRGRFVMSVGMWLYDLLSLFRAPGLHKYIPCKKLLQEIPFLKPNGLKGGFKYYDASMWDDVLVVETLRAASTKGVAIANYMEASEPLWEGDKMVGFKVSDRLAPTTEVSIKANQVVICAGPWTDLVGEKMKPHWKPWLNPSKGIHLIFDLKRIPLPGAIVMSHPIDRRIAFVIPRPDMGAGVAIVGTTDGPTPANPEQAGIEDADVHYLLDLLQRTFPALNLTEKDIISAYVGIRALVGNPEGSEETNKNSLQEVSREHYIGKGPGGSVIVAGGKYTTHRTMAEEIVDFTLNLLPPGISQRASPSHTKVPINPMATQQAIDTCLRQAKVQGLMIPTELISRYGAEANEVLKISSEKPSQLQDPEGFPHLEAQLRFSIRNEMVINLEDFYFRRVPLFASRADHGLPWASRLSQVWAEEMGLADGNQQLAQLNQTIEAHEAWKKGVSHA